ncbi:hypothetical protein [Flavobacterium aestivum]|uniref:hypothetical protein n=1 Tax=Flavobacterium aestivum TaxID=3003257 RepID=UPI00248268D0|nr:hypothetical protein [Flavobacterium aestivum]
MQFIYPKIKVSVLLILFITTAFKTYSQTNSEISLYTKFDSIVGKKNLEIYNGPRQINYYRTFDKSHSYYSTDNFTLGNVLYNKQYYYDIELKYDVNNDQLVIKPIDEYNYLGIILSKEKTASFTINKRKFVNLNYGNPILPEYINGYYEEIIIGNTLIFYIKNQKTRKKIIDNKQTSDGTEQITYDEFTDKNTYYIKLKNTFYSINSKKEIITIFPENKKEIKEYYSKNSELEQSNKELFLENILKYINPHLLINQTKNE